MRRRLGFTTATDCRRQFYVPNPLPGETRLLPYAPIFTALSVRMQAWQGDIGATGDRYTLASRRALGHKRRPNVSSRPVPHRRRSDQPRSMLVVVSPPHTPLVRPKLSCSRVKLSNTDYLPRGQKPRWSLKTVSQHVGWSDVTECTGWDRKRGHRLMTTILSILNRFKKKSLEDSLVNLQLNGYQQSHRTFICCYTTLRNINVDKTSH